MELNSDFTKRVSVHASKVAWQRSPMPGVERRMLDRLGGEVARATTIVRFAPESKFSPHVHTGGEEFFVLEGVFQDEHGDFPAGSYVRNPPQSRHTPRSDGGCTIFVKLWQFDLSDRKQVNIDTNKISFAAAVDRQGVEEMKLFHNDHEVVRLEQWRPGLVVQLDVASGLELLVLDGSFVEGGELFVKHSWLRLPPGEASSLSVGMDGARVWLKSGHLAETPTAPEE